MAQDNTVSFKAYLLQGATDGKPEVRRFGVDRDVVSSFDYLKGKLQHVFPSLRNQNFIVIWKDADGDDVIISSDDELLIALSEMESEVRKLYIKVLEDNARSTNTESAGQTFEAAAQAHKGVICDQCDKEIEGFRYHCIECYDYDLCGTCEAKKTHREHIMIRLPVPVPMHTLHPYMGHLMTHMSALKGHHGRDRRHHHGRHGKGKWWNPNKTMSEMLAAGMNCSGDEGMQCPYVKAKQNASAEEKREQMKTKCETLRKEQSKKAEYLWSVGQKIAEFLDPWGIDVDVEVLTRDEKEKQNEGKKGEEKMETEETKNEEPKSNAGEGSEAGPSHAPQASTSSSVAEPELMIPETDDWTVLNVTSGQQQQQQQQQENRNAANLEDASEGTSESSSDDDQTSVIEVQLNELRMASDPDDVEEIYISGPCARGRKRKSDIEWRKKHGYKKGDLKKHSHKGSDSESRKKHGHKRSGSESRKNHGHKRSGSESRKSHMYKRNVSGSRKKHGHRSRQDSGNPPEATVAGTNPPEATVTGTSVNQLQNRTGTTEIPTSGCPFLIATPPQIGFGRPSADISAPMLAGVGLNAPRYIGAGPGPVVTAPPVYVRSTEVNAPAYDGMGPVPPCTSLSRLYPELNTPFQLHSAHSHQDPTLYTRPHIAEAVRKMMAMGFSNEGGWLTQLLEIKNGDIEKALDVLQPVKKSS